MNDISAANPADTLDVPEDASAADAARVLKKNDCIELDITGITSEGSGVGRAAGGMAVFVPFTAPGDRLLCRIVKTAKTHAYGRIEQLLRPSPDRVGRPDGEADCPVFGRCGGCALRHVTYEAELRYKEQRVADALARIGRIGVAPEAIVAGASPDGYRNKAQYPVAPGTYRPQIGFYAPRSHRVVEHDRCLLQPEGFSAAVAAVRRWMKTQGVPPYDEAARSGLVRHIYIRRGEEAGADAAVMVCLVCTSGKLPRTDLLTAALRESVAGLRSVMVNINRRDTNVVLGEEEFVLWGEDHITDRLCGLTFRLSPRSFYQVNHAQAEALYALAAEAAMPSGGAEEEWTAVPAAVDGGFSSAALADNAPGRRVLDLYCGTGTIGLSMAGRAAEVVGVDSAAAAIEDARRNAEDNGIGNAQFLCADAADAAAALRAEGWRPDVVVLDPPRKGAAPALLDTVAAMSPERIVYVSCDPATLARDLALLEGKGYATRRVTPVDMFPRTTHVETVCLLSKLNTEHHIEVDLKLDELDLTSSESKATYEEIKNYVLKTTGLKVSSLYISQIKRKLGLEVGVCYNLPKSDNARVPECPAEKETAITAALKHFEMS